MKNRVAFLTDSAIDLTLAELDAMGVAVVAQQVIIDGQSYRDVLEISQAEVIAAQLAGKKMSTSQVNPADFTDKYEELLQNHDAVVSVHVSSKVSGTVNTAKMIAKEFGGRVHVIDSLSLNAGMKYALLKTQELVNEGVDLDRLQEALNPYISQINILVLPNTLEWILKSGRISTIQHFAASLLKILPLLVMEQGEVRPLEKARGFPKGIARIGEHLHRRYQKARITLIHIANQQAVDELRHLVTSEGIVIDGVQSLGPAIGVHGGPGIIGIVAAPLN